MSIPDVATRPAKGQTWYAKNKDASSLMTLYVSDVTALTVEVADDQYSRRRRLLLSDIEFIEMVIEEQ